MTLGSLEPPAFWFIAQIVVTVCGEQTKVLKIKSALRTSLGTSLVAQWLRIRLPMQGTRV